MLKSFEISSKPGQRKINSGNFFKKNIIINCNTMELSQETREWLRDRNIDLGVVPLLQKAGLVNVDLLTSVTFEYLQHSTGSSHLARYILYKVRPPDILPKSVQSFLQKCDIGAKLQQFFRRLRVKNVQMIRLITIKHLKDVGMDELDAEYVMGLLKKKFGDQKSPKSPKFPPSPKVSNNDSDESSEDESSEEESSEEESSEEEEFEGNHRLINHVKTSSLAINNKRKRPSVVDGKNKWISFRDAKKLHLSSYSSKEFYDLYDKFNFERMRLGNGKWKYRFLDGNKYHYGLSLKEIMDISIVEQIQEIEP